MVWGVVVREGEREQSIFKKFSRLQIPGFSSLFALPPPPLLLPIQTDSTPAEDEIRSATDDTGGTQGLCSVPRLSLWQEGNAPKHMQSARILPGLSIR